MSLGPKFYGKVVQTQNFSDPVSCIILTRTGWQVVMPSIAYLGKE